MYLIDTDICIEFFRDDKKVVNFLSKLGKLNISIITLAELFYGIYNSKNKEKHKKTLFNFLTNVNIINVNFFIVNNFGKIKSQLKNKGSFIGDFDIINASISQTYDLNILTRNVKHYNKIKNIRIKSI